MILGIDGRLANEEKRAGVGAYCTELLRALSAQGGDIRLRIYLDAPARHEFPVSADQAEFRILPRRRFWTYRVLARELRADPPDVYLSPVMQLPFGCPCPAIATVHDLAVMTFGAHFTWRRRIPGRLQARHVVRSAAHLIADSQATQRDLRTYFHVPDTRISVAWAGCSAPFRQPPEAEAIRRVREKHALPERFVLYVGRLQPRKNIARLVEAFARLRARRPGLPHHLILAGGEGWLSHGIHRAVEASSAREYIRFTGFIPEEDLPPLMAAADVLALVSLWEGFGLPVVEAMACGTAVLTSTTSSLPEVAGDAAALVDPYDVDAISAALERLLTDDAYRHDLEARGPAQAAKFTWEATARTVLDAVTRCSAR